MQHNDTAPKAPLRILEGEQTFQLFSDRDDGTKRRAMMLHGTYAELYDTLKRYNDEQPYGIYFTVNQTNGRGRSAKDITGIRAYFIDIDGITDPQDKNAAFRALESGPLPPSAVVLSANGVHAYWYAAAQESTDPDEFSRTNIHLIAAYGGDKAVKDIARVLRVPGFNHHKSEHPYRITTLTERNNRIYTAAQIREAYPLPTPTARPHTYTPTRDWSGNDEHYQRDGDLMWRIALEAISSWPPAEGQKHSALLTSFGVARKCGIPQARAEQELAHIVSRWPIKSSVDHAIRNTSNWAYSSSAEPISINALKAFGMRIPSYKTIRERIRNYRSDPPRSNPTLRQ